MKTRDELVTEITTKKSAMVAMQKDINKLDDKLKKMDKIVYSIGDKFYDARGNEWVLVMADTKKVVLVNIASGFAYGSTTTVKNIMQITAKEFAVLSCKHQVYRYFDSQKEL